MTHTHTHTQRERERLDGRIYFVFFFLVFWFKKIKKVGGGE